MGRFQTTRWSLIAATRDAVQARPALEQLCRAYRPPVLAFIRRSGCAPSEAEDLAQAFFLHFIEHGWYAAADPARGRFRSLLLSALRNFLHDQHAQSAALKRGGAALRADALPDELAGDADTPEQAFTRAWLATVLTHAMARLRDEWEQAGKRAQFEQLAPLLLERADAAELKEMARALGVRSNTLAVQGHRMRQRLRQLVRLELLQTVGSREALEAELAELRVALDAPA